MDTYIYTTIHTNKYIHCHACWPQNDACINRYMYASIASVVLCCLRIFIMLRILHTFSRKHTYRLPYYRGAGILLHDVICLIHGAFSCSPNVDQPVMYVHAHLCMYVCMHMYACTNMFDT
jgi:hypothetical protein